MKQVTKQSTRKKRECRRKEKDVFTLKKESETREQCIRLSNQINKDFNHIKKRFAGSQIKIRKTTRRQRTDMNEFIQIGGITAD